MLRRWPVQHRCASVRVRACVHSHVLQVVCTDYPSEPVLATLRSNLERLAAPGVATVEGHEWGTDATPVLARLPAGCDGFDLVLAADTLWMPEQHGNLARSIAQVLSRREGARAVMAFSLQHKDTFKFFDRAREEQGLAWREVEVIKLPVMLNGKEVTQLSEEGDLKRTVFVYELRWPQSGAAQ